MTRALRWLLLPLYLLGALPQPANAAEGNADATALLQGVLAVREQIPPSRLRIRAITETAFLTATGTSFFIGAPEYTTLFNRERRYFTSTDTNAAPGMLFDGKDVYAFTGSSVVVRNLDTLMGEYLFDPRVMGLTTAYDWSDTAQRLVRLKAPRIELMGQEEIAGKPAWHVRMTEAKSNYFDLWIDPKNNFAVYRSDETQQYAHRSMRSVYGNPTYRWLPSRIEGEEFDAKENVRYRRRIEVLEAQANFGIPEGTWTLTNLMAEVKLPYYVPIMDVRSGTNAGYWHKGVFKSSLF